MGRASLMLGSPPHMRGKVSGISAAKTWDRITPAYAGKSPQCTDFCPVRRDHPRICGEKSWPTLTPKAGRGSPPHMRGKVWWNGRNNIRTRITPAYAGKSELAFVHGRYRQDHPRICGEKGTIADYMGIPTGSPPHMRGKGAFQERMSNTAGITPAYAGKSQGSNDNVNQQRDHPRICGEKTLCFICFSPKKGSPPHMRGKARPVLQPRTHHRITPAYAGKRMPSPATQN